MPQANADRNLLFGILALQMDFIARDQLVAAMQTWVFAKATPLGEILCNQGALAKDTHSLLEALVEKHLAQHGNDTEKSLAAIGAAGSIRERLKQVADPDLQASLVHVASAKTADDDPYMTRAQSVGAATSSGTRFRILRPHARGGLGEVLVARDEELHREVALKQIQEPHADNRESRDRFLLEAEITGGLEHPGIVPVYGLGQYADGRPYYAMRFIRGDSLKDAIERFHKDDIPGRDPGERSLQLRSLLGRFVDVCNAMAYAHSRGVLHRDLKPGNIMLGKYGETLVVDWGLAKPGEGITDSTTQAAEGTLTLSSGSFASQTLMGAVVGTPQFMSPEQAAGRLDQMGPPSDVYSLGATLYSLLTGIPPISGADVGVLLQKVQRGEFPPPRQIKPNISPALEAVCLKAMALLPGDRYTSPRLLAGDIEHWLADEPVSAWTEPWSVKARRWIGRHRTSVVGLASAIVVAGAVLAMATVLLTAANERERAARTDAQRKEQEANEQRDEARTQKELADHNYQLARRAVDRYHTEVSESVLLHEPGMQPLRKKLLEAAREFYEQFVREHADNPKVLAELGKSLFRLAQITGDIGSEIEAIDLHDKARKIFTALAVDRPADAEIQSDLAIGIHHLGRLYRRTDRIADSERAYKDALTIWESLAGPPPHADRFAADLARSQLGLGNVYEVTGRLDEARTIYLSALAIRERLAKEHRDEPAYRRDLAISQHNLAMVYSGLGKQAQAESTFHDALKTQKQLVADYPHISQYENDLARTQYNLGDLRAQAGSSLHAEAPYREAERAWKDLIRKYPDDTDFQSNLADVYAALATMYISARKSAKAAEAGQLSLDIKQKLADAHNEVPRYRGDLARAHYLMGNVDRADGNGPQAESAYEKAAIILEKLTAGYPLVPQYQNDLARCANNMGLLLAPCGAKEKSEKEFLKALRLWKKLHAAHPKEREFALGVVTATHNLGNLLVRNADPKGAVDWYTQAIDACSSLEYDPNKQSPARTALTNALWKRADALSRLNEYARAVEDWDRALQLAAAAQRPWFRLYRIRALAGSGQHTLADAEALALEKDAAKSGEASYQLACTYSLCSATAANDLKLTPNERRMLADRYAARAFQFIARAQATGYFKSFANLDKLADDSDLDSLRSRTAFQKLLNELKDEVSAATGPS